MSVEELFDLEPDERDDFFCEKDCVNTNRVNSKNIFFIMMRLVLYIKA